MSIQELLYQFTIQGAYIIKGWDDEICDCVTLVEGSDFECEQWDIDDKILNADISYMYAIDDVLNIEIEWNTED
jgi:hypothetical protein